MSDPFGDLIYSYTRKQAIEDGVLIDVTETAKNAGFAVPVALTAGAWSEAVSTENKEPRYCGCGSETGRLMDVLSMLRFSILMAEQGQRQVNYSVFVTGSGKARKVNLKAIIGPGDSGEPVMTIMLPHED